MPAKTVERDYVLSHAIAAIASTNGPQRAAFKGGTCLRFLHFAEYRYSADLDFSVLQGTKDEVLFQFADAFKKADVGAELRLTDGSPPRIAFTAPLGKERTIKLDLADDEYVVHTTRFPLLRRWPDLPDVQVLAYTPLEVCAEKLRCVLQRLQ